MVPGVQATEHETEALGARKLAQAVGDHERRVETELPKWLQPFTEGWTRGSSCSTDVSPADVAIPPPAIHPSAHPPAKLTSNNSGGKHNLFTYFPKDPILRSMQTHERTACRRNPDHRADRIKIAERFGDMLTADNKVLNEEQESRLYHRYAVVVQELATQWIQRYMQNQIRSGNAEKSQKILTSR